jgi:hypothetical protein
MAEGMLLHAASQQLQRGADEGGLATNFLNLRNKPVRRPILWYVLIPVLFTVACSREGSNLTGPSNQIPDVAGNLSR